MAIDILVVDDEPLQRDVMRMILEGEGYRVETAASGVEALDHMEKNPADLILTDLKMQGMDGLEILESLRERGMAPPVLIVTAHGTIDSAIDAVRKGAFDYLTKPLEKTRLLLAVSKACEQASILKENARLRQELFGRFRFEGIIATSPSMHQIIRLLMKVAESSSTVMLLGESGASRSSSAAPWPSTTAAAKASRGSRFEP